jgi:hypothetical protein
MARIESSQALVGKTVTRIDGSTDKIVGLLAGGYKMAEGRKLSARNLTKVKNKFVEIEKTDIRLLDPQEGYVLVKKEAASDKPASDKPDDKPYWQTVGKKVTGGKLGRLARKIDKRLLDVIDAHNADLHALLSAEPDTAKIEHHLVEGALVISITVIPTKAKEVEAKATTMTKSELTYNPDALVHRAEAFGSIKSWEYRRDVAKHFGLSLTAVRPGLVFVDADDTEYVLDYSTRSDLFVLRQVANPKKTVRLGTTTRLFSGAYRPVGADDSALDAKH